MAISSDTSEPQWFRGYLSLNQGMRPESLAFGRGFFLTRLLFRIGICFSLVPVVQTVAGEWCIAVCATGSSSVLILTRRPTETICIGDDVRVTVLGIKGDQVRIGIEAPDAVAVHREEIYDKIQAEAADSGRDSPG